jgi:glycosyltransferase involved in cell wall biosynthesis
MASLGHINLAVLAIHRLLLPGSPCIIREANTPSRELASHHDARWMRYGYRLLYPRAALTICPSQQIAAELTEDFGVPSERIRVMANPVDVTAVRTSAQVPEREPGDGPRFISVSRLTTAKAIDEMLDMLASCRADSHLTIVGDGPERGTLETIVRKKDLARRVRFAGYLQAPWPLIAGADALLLTSRFEGMPNVALEALACGTAVIATPETGGLPEVAAQVGGKGIVIAARGEPFVAAMNDTAPCDKRAPAPSLLPPAFTLDQAAGAVVAEIERLIAAAEPRR